METVFRGRFCIQTERACESLDLSTEDPSPFALLLSGRQRVCMETVFRGRFCIQTERACESLDLSTESSDDPAVVHHGKVL
jgi:hypothetical protein